MQLSQFPDKKYNITLREIKNQVSFCSKTANYTSRSKKNFILHRKSPMTAKTGRITTELTPLPLLIHLGNGDRKVKCDREERLLQEKNRLLYILEVRRLGTFTCHLSTKIRSSVKVADITIRTKPGIMPQLKPISVSPREVISSS